jgi:hypothetical protein
MRCVLLEVWRYGLGVSACCATRLAVKYMVDLGEGSSFLCVPLAKNNIMLLSLYANRGYGLCSNAHSLFVVPSAKLSS